METGLYACFVYHWVRTPLNLNDYWVFESEMALVFNGSLVAEEATHRTMDDSARTNRQYLTFEKLEDPRIDAAREWVRLRKVSEEW